MSGNLRCFSPHMFLCKPIRNLSRQQDRKATEALNYGYTWQLSCGSQLWVMEIMAYYGIELDG